MLYAMDGVRFSCRPGCTSCCRERGFVYLTRRDLERAARLLGMTGRAFERRYVYRTKHLLRLRKPRGSECHFLLDSGCSIHSAKPAQCRLFPFWPELVASRAEWSRAGRICPGVGTGQLIQIGTALESAAEMRRAYPSLYPD